MTGQETWRVGDWSEERPNASGTSSLREQAEWIRQQSLRWALGATPGAWMCHMVKQGRGHWTYYSNPVCQPGELSDQARFPGFLFDYFVPLFPSNHLPVLTSCPLSPWLSLSLNSSSPDPQRWILLHTPSLFSFSGAINFLSLLPKCRSSVCFLCHVFSYLLSHFRSSFSMGSFSIP